MSAVTPPEAPLLEAVRALEGAGIECALGGSGLLAAHGLSDTVHDWDLTTDALLDRVEGALAGRPLARFGPSGLHTDHKLVLEGGVVEVIVGFSIRSGSDAVRLPTVIARRRDAVPLGSLEVWATAYHLLGREARSATAFDWLGKHGADPAVTARLLDQPLPAELRRRLEALPRR